MSSGITYGGRYKSLSRLDCTSICMKGKENTLLSKMRNLSCTLLVGSRAGAPDIDGSSYLSVFRMLMFIPIKEMLYLMNTSLKTLIEWKQIFLFDDLDGVVQLILHFDFIIFLLEDGFLLSLTILSVLVVLLLLSELIEAHLLEIQFLYHIISHINLVELFILLGCFVPSDDRNGVRIEPRICNLFRNLLLFHPALISQFLRGYFLRIATILF